MPGQTVKFHEGVYTFLKNEAVHIPTCEPLQFLAELRKYQRI